MSARPSGTRPTGSVGPAITTVGRRVPSEYTDFYLASLWDWTPAGVNRVITFLENLNVDRPTYRYEPDYNLFEVRCANRFASYIRRNFCQLLRKIEKEYVDAMEANGVTFSPQDTDLQVALHPDVMIPINFPKVHMPPSSDADSSFGAGLGPNDTGGLVHRRPDMMSLVVPDELRDITNIIVWQDLQAKDKSFERNAFATPAARAALESAFGVKIITDIGQKVIFIGQDGPSTEGALEVKTRLTNLLRDYLASLRKFKVSRHVYFIESATRFTIDTREAAWVNPVLPRSTIIDPWKHEVPEQYKYFERPGGAFVLRACLFMPKKNGVQNQYWSIYGPYAKNVFNGRQPTRRSGWFDGLKATPRARVADTIVGPGPVSSWLNAVGNNAPDDAVPIAAIETAGTATPVPEQVDEDAPLVLAFDPSSKKDLAAIRARRSAPLPGVMAKPQGSLLDQQDAFLNDPNSMLQLPLKPSLRTMSVPNPDKVGLTSSSSRNQIASSSSLSKFSTQTGTNESHTSDQELGIFVQSLCRILDTMRAKYGGVQLRAEIGRLFMCDVPDTGRAVNQEAQAANGWLPDDLRLRLDAYPNCFFTTPLSSWGNDADFLGSGVWQPDWRTVFFDFSFQAWLGSDLYDLVVEVNAEDYTWKIRFRNNHWDKVTVHCLAQSWDFQAHVRYFNVVECDYYWGKFAQALVDSLEVKPPALVFQHTFSEAPVTDPESPITVQAVRARQVCRFRHQNEKTCLYLTRTLPTEDKASQDPAYREVVGVLSKSSHNDPTAGDDRETGQFAQFFEASVTSVRLEELLSQNRDLIPGGTVDWTAQQIEGEGLLADMYTAAAELVKGIDGVGVECDNGIDLRRTDQAPAGSYMW